MNKIEFTCFNCGGLFEDTQSDEEAMHEAKALWGDQIEKEKTATLCEDCHKEFMRWHKTKRAFN